MDPLALLAEFVALPAPPGKEEAVRNALQKHLGALGLRNSVDAKGNLLVPLSKTRPRVVITAHMDEIAMIVQALHVDGSVRVSALGGLFPWKLGEGPVQLLTPKGPIDGVLSFGSIHTADPISNVRRADLASLDWPMARVLTGRSAEELIAMGVSPGTRVVVGPQRRTLVRVGPWVSGFFLDDRADLVSWLLALEALRGKTRDAIFVATACEEVGGEGALFMLQEYRPDICIALELGPDVADAPVDLTDEPTVWVNDSYSAMSASDLELIKDVAKDMDIALQFQALSRGGSDASCAASHGLCARPITLGLPMRNSHGFEVMHPGAMAQLARLTCALVERVLLPA